MQSIDVRPAVPRSKNELKIDGFQVRRITSYDESHFVIESPGGDDTIQLSSGDLIFGRLIGLNLRSATVEAFGERQSLPWSQMIGLNWRQPDSSISQTVPPTTGLFVRVEMQPFVDRPECVPEVWTVTIQRVDANQMFVQHSLIGKMTFRWTDIRRLDPLFFGQSILVDARQFHLGNSIRPDLHRPLPDGTEIQGVFPLKEIPSGKVSMSFNLAELEAAGTDAPPASPFLADLRAGRLVTELFINNQKVGTVNSHLRFKTNSQHPERIRMEIPRSLLKIGDNSYRLRQQPLKQGGHEYDDCELGDIRLEFEMR
jgi:hypothetical protein